MTRTFTAIPFDGLNTDCLGNYLAGLGLISAVALRWSTIRACWRNQRVVLLSPDGPSAEQVKQYLLKTWNPIPFQRWWDAAFNEDRAVAKKHMMPTALHRERSQADPTQVRVLDATVVVHHRPITNPLLGPLAGKVSDKRNLANAHAAAVQWIAVARTDVFSETGLSRKAEAALKRFQKRSDCLSLAADWLSHTLFGNAAREIPQLAGMGTWFGSGNRTYNSGQDWYREGQLSPWSVLLAMEGVLLLVGGVNRRLGSRARPYAVFPFMSDPARPESEGELDVRCEGEFWAPLWNCPATLTEVRALFQRGLAKSGSRSAQAPHEFAVAALDAGVDSGVSEFVRYELRQTTSSQVYESIPRERIRVRSRAKSIGAEDSVVRHSQLLIQLIESGWIDRLPRDTTRPRRFYGLRGPIEAAILHISEHAEDADRWQQLLLRLAASQARIDRNKALRERCAPIPLLSAEWFEHAWPAPRPREIEITRAIASVGWHVKSTPIPLLANVFGVTLTCRQGIFRTTLPKTRTAQAVWGPGDPLQNLLDLGQRRLTDAENLSRTPFAGTHTCPVNLIQGFFTGNTGVDFEQIARWIPALSLINWSRRPSIAIGVPELESNEARYVADGTGMLHALARPFFHCDSQRNLFLDDGSPLFQRDQLPRPNLLRRLFNLLRFGELNEAVHVLRNRYFAVGRSIVMPPEGLVADGERIAAALLIPMSNDDIRDGLRRWLHSARNR